ncbi:Prp9p [Paramicrosporidium saccamoebae]|uniref:Prp9p n=1 Tax=Paramicrosporidium saccamoebae TaxID=1246581 RepID=A0A2H9TFL9_9FUNG|nr:Prp9p [Paramicrosporidium saccamoebae]
MDGILDVQRREHEEVDRLEQRIVQELIDAESTQKGRLMQERMANALFDQMQRTALHLGSLYEDVEGERQREIESITITNNEFGDFYTRLKELKDVHRRFPSNQPIDDSEFESLVNSCRVTEEAFEALFSGEEMHGRYLDLVLPYQRYVNLKNVRKLDYLQYLEEFDNFEAIPMATKMAHGYSRYLEELEAYFSRYFQLSKPLFNFDSAKKTQQQEFERLWKEAKLVGWEEAAQKESLNTEKLYCGPCDKVFTNKSVYQAHLGGKKHLKAAESHNGANIERNEQASVEGNERMSNCKSMALNEFLITKYAEILGNVRAETRMNVERKQSRTLEEREEDILVEETAPILSEDEEDDDGRIYNPLNIPLDWDGKPIPYWLWKLHGLGVRFSCEICGNHDYMGRKAFDQHFFEWRHMWDKLKQTSRMENFRPEAMEEFEDHLGNVYNRKTYEDLRRQGLI